MRPAPLAAFTAFSAIALLHACSGPAGDRAFSRPTSAEDKVSYAAGQPMAPSAARADVALAASASPADAPPSAEPHVPSPAFAAEALLPTMIIRTGTASVEVDTLESGVTRVRELARRVGGYVANTSLQAGRDRTRSATIEIRLPAARYDDALSGLSPLGHVESVNVTAEDVGEEYVDVTARAANAHRLEQRLIEVLATKTGKLRDVLDVERELARVREEIERMEGRLRFLRTRAAVSTLTVTVHEPYPVVGERGSSSVIGEAFRQSWRNFVQFTARLIAALGTVVPALLLLIATAAGAIRLWRRGRRSSID